MRIEDDIYKPIAGSDPILDIYTMGTGCQELVDPATLHDLYDCSGASQLVRTFTSIASHVDDDRLSCNGILECSDAMTLVHLVPLHLDKSLLGIDMRLTEMKNEVKSAFENAMTAIYVASIVIILMAFVIEFQFLSKLETAYNVCLCLLKKLPPSSILGNTDLLDYILGKKKSDARIKTSVAENIVLGSTDGIILASHLGIIDVVNQACCNILACSQEDLLGQHMTVIFGGDGVADIQAQIQLLQDHQRNSDMWEGEVNCKTQDDNKTLLCQVTILAMYGSDGCISDLIMIIRDISELHDQQIESQKAKAQAEDLLYAILPPSIVHRLASGDNDVTFVVPEASVMFVDIIKFSEFSSALTPGQIMGTLAALFGSFDSRLAKWKTVTKIKLIGDVYMCAAGLFDDCNPATSAEEIVWYATECLQCLDDQNCKMDIALRVRIGINTGGPIIAGVLGSDNRVFDIIGDAINVASRLQSTAPPNTIQLSQVTHLHVSGMNLPMQKRENVMLKGKDAPVTTWLLSVEGSVASVPT
jgi:PAS domain S-box-containing protein